VWRNPATNAVEQKHSLIQRVDKVLLGVGYYSK
jgi:cytochrome c